MVTAYTDILKSENVFTEMTQTEILQQITFLLLLAHFHPNSISDGFVLLQTSDEGIENKEQTQDAGDLDAHAQMNVNEEQEKMSPLFQQSNGPAPIDSNNERDKRSPKFLEGPQNQICIWNPASSGDRFYDHVDETGRSCTCNLCDPGYILVQDCSCSIESDFPQPSECLLVEQGKQMMPDTNKCTTGYDCKVCEHPWTVMSECGPRGPDTVCECVIDGYYLVSPDDCRPIPRCNKGYEPMLGYGEYGSEMRCQQCSEGYYQPNDDSTDRCKKHTECTLREGTSQSDTVCRSDVVPMQLMEESVQTGFPEQSASPEDTTPNPTHPQRVTQKHTEFATSSPTNGTSTTADEKTDQNTTTHTSSNTTGVFPTITSTYCMTWEIAIFVVAFPCVAVGSLVAIILKIMYDNRRGNFRKQSGLTAIYQDQGKQDRGIMTEPMEVVIDDGTRHQDTLAADKDEHVSSRAPLLQIPGGTTGKLDSIPRLRSPSFKSSSSSSSCS